MDPAPFASDDILLGESPDPADGLEVLHDREYRVRAFRKADDRLLIRGAVRDQKPPGLYIEVDPDPMTIHHMQIDLEVSFPSLEIVGTEVRFESHPNDTCPNITEHYGALVGLSIARGFTHKVRELFGGPRGCTHTTALLQAMAPVAVQCFWSMHASTARRQRAQSGDGAPAGGRASMPWRMNLDTCHVWASDGEWVQAIESGQASMPVPVFLRRRLDELGLDASAWLDRVPD